MKFRSLAASCAAFLLFSVPAMAVDAGWRVQFHHDAFEDKTYPLAVVYDGDDFNSASMGMACLDGGIAVTFFDGQISFGGADISARFRDSAGAVHDMVFEHLELPPFGNRRAVSGDNADALIEVFMEASNPVPFQTDHKQSNLPIAGFTQVYDIMVEHCAAL